MLLFVINKEKSNLKNEFYQKLIVDYINGNIFKLIKNEREKQNNFFWK